MKAASCSRSQFRVELAETQAGLLSRELEVAVNRPADTEYVIFM